MVCWTSLEQIWSTRFGAAKWGQGLLRGSGDVECCSELLRSVRVGCLLKITIMRARSPRAEHVVKGSAGSSCGKRGSSADRASARASDSEDADG